MERKSAGREWHVRAELRVWNGREWHFSRRKYFLCMPTTCAVSREPTLANANSPMRHAGDHAVPTAPHDSSDPVCFSTIHARYQSSTPRARRSPERLHDGSRGVAHVGVLVLRGERRLQPREDGWRGVGGGKHLQYQERGRLKKRLEGGEEAPAAARGWRPSRAAGGCRRAAGPPAAARAPCRCARWGSGRRTAAAPAPARAEEPTEVCR